MTRSSFLPAEPQAAFTLLELLVVVGLIAVTSFLVAGGLGSGKPVALSSGQTLLSNLVTAARTRASATGRKTRILVSADPAHSSRYLRMLVLQVGQQTGPSPGDWLTLQTVVLPAGVYVVPNSLNGLTADAAQWKRPSNNGDDLSSDLFMNQNLTYVLDGDSAAQLWTGMAFTPNGTLASLAGGPPPKGSVVIALGQVRAAGSYSPGEPPVQLEDPSRACGLLLSAYGVPALLANRDAF